MVGIGCPTIRQLAICRSAGRRKCVQRSSPRPDHWDREPSGCMLNKNMFFSWKHRRAHDFPQNQGFFHGSNMLELPRLALDLLRTPVLALALLIGRWGHQRFLPGSRWWHHEPGQGATWDEHPECCWRVQLGSGVLLHETSTWAISSNKTMDC